MRGQSLLQGAAPKLLSSRLVGRRNQQPGIGSSRFGRDGLPFAASPPVGGTEYACSCCQDALPRSIGRRKFFSSSTSNGSQHEEAAQGRENGAAAPPNDIRRRPSVATTMDPTAKRPTAKCDPYGQGGKPMDVAQAKMLLSTVHADWRIVAAKDGSGKGDARHGPSLSALRHDGDIDVRGLPSIDDDIDGGDGVALYLVRDFGHSDFVSAGRFAAVVAAVAEIQAHYPRRLVVERRVVKKSWVVATTVICQTQVLGGLSINDFHLAMMMDVEVERPEVRKLLLPMEDPRNCRIAAVRAAGTHTGNLYNGSVTRAAKHKKQLQG